MLRVCVIGMGPIGNRHARLYKQIGQAELVGVCDIVKEKADAAAAKLGVRAFYDAPTMLTVLKPDIVSVTTAGVENGSDHYLPTIQALDAGCHVLCEKPMCNEIAPAEAIFAELNQEIIMRITEPFVAFFLIGRLAILIFHQSRMAVATQRIVPAHAIRGDRKERMAQVAHQHMTARESGGVLGLERIGQVEPVEGLFGVVGHQADIGAAVEIGDPQGRVPPQPPRPEPATGEAFFKKNGFAAHK